MKTFTVIVAVLCSSIANAQWENVNVSFSGDTVKISDTNLYETCGSVYVTDVQVIGDTIFVNERDTSSLHAICSCFFDVYVALTGLGVGEYHVQMYRHNPWFPQDSLKFVASLTFTVSSPTVLPPSQKATMAACHQAPVFVKPLKEPVPENFALLMNYPNPFNPTTHFRFTISNPGFVTLKVFDALGREVAALVNEQKLPGTYEVQFDASHLASGTYFGIMDAGTIHLVQKTMLLQ